MAPGVDEKMARFLVDEMTSKGRNSMKISDTAVIAAESWLLSPTLGDAANKELVEIIQRAIDVHEKPLLWALEQIAAGVGADGSVAIAHTTLTRRNQK